MNYTATTTLHNSLVKKSQWTFCPAGAVAKLSAKPTAHHATSGKKIRKKGGKDDEPTPETETAEEI